MIFPRGYTLPNRPRLMFFPGVTDSLSYRSRNHVCNQNAHLSSESYAQYIACLLIGFIVLLKS